MTTGPLAGAKDMSGLTVGNQFDSTFIRDTKAEKDALTLGYTKEQIEERGGVNAQGYWGDVPGYSRLTAEEYKSVTKSDGTINTAAQAALYQNKAFNYFKNQGYNAQESANLVARNTGDWGDYGIKFKDENGNLIFGQRRGSLSSGAIDDSTPNTGSTSSTSSTNPSFVKGVAYGGYDANGNPSPTGNYNSFGVYVGNSELTDTQISDRADVMDTLTARFKQYGLESLVPTIKKLAQEGATDATITLALQESDAYKQRFAGNQERIARGLSALSPAAYLNLEDTYRQTLRAYGLTQFDNNKYVTQFIANDMSPSELSQRVATGVQRLQMADPAVLSQLQSYYGIGASDVLAYTLDTKNQLPEIQRKITASEIGASAGKQGLVAGQAVAEQLAAQGVDAQAAQRGYATIADVLPTAEKLSEIYGGRAGTYNQSTAEQEVFNSLASAQRARQKLSATEVASFSGQSGASKGAFSSGYLNRQSPAGQF